MKQSSGFAVVPAEVLATGNGYAIAVYAAIAQHADPKGVAWPSIKRLVEITGWSRPTVDKAVKVLIDSGALKKKNRYENGAKISNHYRLPFHRTSANVQMETTLPTIEASLPRVRKEVSKGTQPGFHEQEPIEQEPKEFDSTLRVMKHDAELEPLPAVRGDTPAHLIVNEFYRIIGGKPAAVPKDIGHGKTLANAGVNPSDLPALIAWVKKDWTGKGGFDLGTLAGNVVRWRTATSGEAQKVKRFVV